MGKGGNQGKGATELEAPMPTFRWEEIQKHNLRTDKWLVIDRKVYNITKWSSRHPGGQRVIGHYAGEDATDAFLAFHRNLDFVRKFMKPLLIGELAPDEPSQDRGKNSQITEDFRALRKTAEDMNLFKSNQLFFLLHLAHIIAMESIAWFTIFYFGNGWIPTIITAFVLATSQAQAGWLQHDYGHLSVYKKSMWNHIVHKFIIGHLKGASANWWNHRHFQHHAKPNIFHKDPDVNMLHVFVLGEWQPIEYGKKKLKYLPYNHQHEYFFLIGPPLLIPLYFQYQIIMTMIVRKDWVDLAWAISYYTRFFITYIPFYGVLGSILFLNFIRFLESHWFVWVTQMNHIVMEIDREPYRDWFSSQLAATCNVEQSFFNDWFSGHLNFQIEHHLFPTMPRHNLHKIAPLVRSLCAKHGIEYQEKPLLRALQDIIGSLRKSGQLWLDAYLHRRQVAAEARGDGALQPDGPLGAFSEACLLDLAPEPSRLSWAPSAEQRLLGATADEGRAEEPPEEQGFLMHMGAPRRLSPSPRCAAPDADTGQTAVVTSEHDLGGGGRPPPWASTSAASTQEQPSRDQVLTSSDEEDIYGHGLPSSSSETSVTELGGGRSLQDLRQLGTDDPGLLKADQFAESWMGYSGPGHGILSLAVSEKYLWCLDYKGGLFCSALPGAGLRWQKFEDAVQQVAVSPSGALLWKIEQKSNRAFACGKVAIKGKRHWYEALPQAVFVALSDDTAWIIRTNGDLYLQTGLSVDRPCARAVKVDCPFPLSQVTARNSVVWALTEQRALLYREGVSSFCPEGELWKCDIVSERQALEPVCITLGDQQSLWALDIRGNLWFRTGIVSKKPQGDDDHWWQVSVTDYVVFDQCSLFQTVIRATHSVATAAQVPVEKVADRLRTAFWSQQLQCQPSLLGVNNSGVWISSGKNEFHVARGSLIGTYWNHVVPRGTASATKWAFVLASTAPTKEGSSLWLCQSSKDLCRVSAQHAQCRPSTVQLPPDAEMRAYAACQDALWALDSLGQVFIRTLSASCPTGMHWARLDLSQLGAVKLTSLACGNQHVWACDSRGGVYFRVGTQPLNPSLMLPAWIAIEPPVQPAGVTLVSVHCSPDDQTLWALDSRWNVHVRAGITEEMPVGTDWEHVPGLQACQLALSTRTVWARCPNGDLARRYGVTDKNPAGDYWKKIPGNVTCVTVTSSDELWAVGPPGYLLQRLTRTFSHSHGAQGSHAATPHPEDLEDEWEVI